ncbi:MAG: hypothetical protein N2657_05965 [bacterium]|nr:hypothetical protein [bacterium]
MKKAYILYLWLSAFTLFISVFSIILFNYTAGDIKITRKLIQETNYQNIIKGVAIVATELYRRGQYSGEYILGKKKYNFSSVRISPTKLLIQISHNNNPVARVIVKDRKYISDINIYFATCNNPTISKYRLHTFATTYDYIQIYNDNDYGFDEGSKMLNYAYIAPETSVNGRSMEVKENEIHFHNLEELKKYAEVAGFIPRDINNFLIKYYTRLANYLGDKSINTRTYPDEPVDLTKYGSLYISKPQGRDINKVELKLRQENNNQVVDIVIDYYSHTDIYRYYLIRYPHKITVIPSSTITNDQDIRDELSRTQNQSEPKNIDLLVNFPGVYKVLVKYDSNDNQKPVRSIIYKTAHSQTLIYSTEDISIGSNSPNSFEGGIVGTDILLVVKNNVIVNGHIAYKEFDTIDELVNFIENRGSFQFPSDSESHLSVVARNIIIDPSNFNPDYILLCGDYSAFYNTSSSINLRATYNGKIYYFGSTVSYERYPPTNEKIVSDLRENKNIFKAQFATCRIMGIEILR